MIGVSGGLMIGGGSGGGSGSGSGGLMIDSGMTLVFETILSISFRIFLRSTSFSSRPSL